MQGVWVQSLVGELRFHMPHGVAKKILKNKNKNRKKTKTNYQVQMCARHSTDIGRKSKGKWECTAPLRAGQKHRVWNNHIWVQSLALPLTTCGTAGKLLICHLLAMTLDKFFSLSVLPFPQLHSGVTVSILHELIHVRCLERGTHYISDDDCHHR